MDLGRIAPSEVDSEQSRALMRLTLATFGLIHELLIPVQNWLTGRIVATADTDGTANVAKLMGVQAELETKWREAFRDYRGLLERARSEAASLPFGALAVRHNGVMTQALQERISTDELVTLVLMWEQRLAMALAATAQRTMGDGLVLSQRIWRLENGGLTQIRALLGSAYAERTNAYALAQQVEGMLGAEQDLPRWTRSRLYRMTPTERAESEAGLLRGPESRGRGVAYNAVRLARTELQYANHAVTTEIARNFPGITGRKVRLSPGHPESDICDEYAAGGPYDVREEILPLHPNCMCYYEEVMMDPKAFAANVRGWAAGDNEFLDGYSEWLGVRDATALLPLSLTMVQVLATWLTGMSDAGLAALRG